MGTAHFRKRVHAARVDAPRTYLFHFPPTMQPTKETAVEVCKVLDALMVLSADLQCADDIPADTLVLSAQRSRDACIALSEAVTALKQILQIAVEAGGGPVPLAVEERLDGDGAAAIP